MKASMAAPRSASAINVPFIDLRKINERFEIADAIMAVASSGRYLHGEQVAAFEEEFARFTGAMHCVALANGLDALRLTLRAWVSMGQLALGDEVLVPANSFVASALAVTDSGLVARLVDVDSRTFNVTRDLVAAAITSRTRAVMPVHLYGQLADVAGIRAYCRERGLLLLEDAAQAHGARSTSDCMGLSGEVAAFSFYPTKNLGSLGDAGCIVTNDALVAARVRALGNYGSSEKYHHDFPGTNSRMDELQAAVLRLKLKWLDYDNQRRRDIARTYRQLINNPVVQLPTHPPDALSHVWHIYAISTSERECLAQHLGAAGIQTAVHYPRVIHQQKAYANSLKTKAPVAERLQHEILSLPISPVMDNGQVEYVAASINDWQPPTFQKA